MQLLDGFDASISFKTQRYAAGALTGTPVEHGCWANAMSLNFLQDVVPLSKIVFCSPPGWKKKAALEREVRGTLSGFASKEHAASPPGLGIDGAIINITAIVDDEGVSGGADVCSVTCDAFMDADSLGIIAKGNSNRGLAWESTGTVSVAWVDE